MTEPARELGESGRRRRYCGARRRDGTPCPNPPAEGKRRCRSHGGAPGVGAPKGNLNAFRHGLYSRVEVELNKQVMDFMRMSNRLLAKAEAQRAYALTRRLRRRARTAAKQERKEVTSVALE